MRACPHKQLANKDYFGPPHMFDAATRALRIRRLRGYLPTLEPQLRAALLAAPRTDLADLGIDAARDL